MRPGPCRPRALGLPRRAPAALALALALCAVAPAGAADVEPPPDRLGPLQTLGAEVVLRALSLLGVSYRLGGSSPDTGLDCSGLVRLAFREGAGLPLPRRSEEMSRSGAEIRRDELRPGDLVFFNTLRRAFSHVGIYIGNNQFVHAPSRGGQVRVENLDARYWAARFDGARRMLADGGDAARVLDVATAPRTGSSMSPSAGPSATGALAAPSSAAWTDWNRPADVQSFGPSR